MREVRIKICGLRTEQDILAVNRFRPDYAGFICAPPFWRYIDREKAAALRDLLDPGIQAVGVFVDQPIRTVLEYVQDGIIELVQLHGQESEEYIRCLRDGAKAASREVPVIRAFQIRSAGDWNRAMLSSADLVLLDGGAGSGQTFDWSLAGAADRPWFLAGGLGPDNLEEALQSLHPCGVDISSGVETDCRKDPAKIEACISIVRKHKEGERTGKLR